MKRATRSKPDVEPVWPVQCAWMTSRHVENDHYWRVVRVWEVGWYKVLQIIEKLASHASRLICDLLGVCRVERGYPWPLAGRLFYRLCLWRLTYHHKDTSGKSWHCGAVYRVRDLAWVWIFLYSLHQRIEAIVEPEGSRMPCHKHHCYSALPFTCPWINLYVDSLIWSYP